MRFGFVLYPGLTPLDLVGPLEVLARVPNAETLLAAEAAGPVAAQHGLVLTAQVAFAATPPLDLLLVPGGPGQDDQMEDPALREFLHRQAEHARWVTAVCTGSLLLAAAGLLRGYRATTHWRHLECLGDLGAIPTAKRIVADRGRITAAGVSAGIDMGLFVAALIAGEHEAQAIQLQIEYDPQPPFRSGSPPVADEAVLAEVESRSQEAYDRRRRQSRRLGAG